jgi:hypothetical protein
MPTVWSDIYGRMRRVLETVCLRRSAETDREKPHLMINVRLPSCMNTIRVALPVENQHGRRGMPKVSVVWLNSDWSLFYYLLDGA